MMDPKLNRAVCEGDVEFLKKAIETEPRDYLLTQWTEYNENYEIENGRIGNILHLAVWDEQEEFLRLALEQVLPTDLALELLSQPTKALTRFNILQMLAWCSGDSVNLGMTRVVLNFYRRIRLLSYSAGPNNPPLTDAQKPWLALNLNNETALHRAIRSDYSSEQIAMELLSMEDGIDKVCHIVGRFGISPLFGAIQKGYNQVADKILMSSSSYSLAAPDGSSPLHLAPTCSELAVKLLLSKHPELIDCVDDNGCNVLHKWLEMDSLWVLELLDEFPEEKTKIYKNLVCQTTEKERGDTPLHIAARNSNEEIGIIVVREYQKEVTSSANEISNEATNYFTPWKIKNREGKMPFQVAIDSKQEQLALLFLSLDPTLCDIYDNTGQSLLLSAVGHGCAKVVAEILKIHKVPPFTMLRRNDGRTLLHFLPYIPDMNVEEAAKSILEKFWWIMNLRDDRGRTALDEAKVANTTWLVNLLMNPSLLHKEPFDWITSCETCDTLAVLAFIDNCEDLHKLYLEQNDTVLHHIKLDTYKEYMKLLKNPSIVELKNATDLNGKTPLHCAIEKKDINLVKALLVHGVDRNIKDFDGITAMKLLAKLYNTDNPDWKKMCKDMKVNPLLKTSYIQYGTDIGAMRNTLSVVAALLATITFAAGFTLPGGYNENTGDAIKAKKAAFLVFLISDAYAMCASMLVLFCLIWSMVSTQDMSYLLVDRSVLILVQALYGTMMAFITGIYAVTATHSLWAAIFVIIMCSVVVISANRTFLHIILSKLIPAASDDQTHQTPKVQEEPTTANGNDSSMNPTLSTANQDQKGHMSVLEAV